MIQAGINKLLTGVGLIIVSIVVGLLTLIDPFSVTLQLIFNLIAAVAGFIGGIYFIIGIALLIFANIEKFRYVKNYDLGDSRPVYRKTNPEPQREIRKYNIKNLKNEFLEIPFENSQTIKDCEYWLIDKLRKKDIYVNTNDFEVMFHLDGVVFESTNTSRKIEGVLFIPKGKL